MALYNYINGTAEYCGKQIIEHPCILHTRFMAWWIRCEQMMKAPSTQIESPRTSSDRMRGLTWWMMALSFMSHGTGLAMALARLDSNWIDSTTLGALSRLFEYNEYVICYLHEINTSARALAHHFVSQCLYFFNLLIYPNPFVPRISYKYAPTHMHTNRSPTTHNIVTIVATTRHPSPVTTDSTSNTFLWLYDDEHIFLSLGHIISIRFSKHESEHQIRITCWIKYQPEHGCVTKKKTRRYTTELRCWRRNCFNILQ